ncbi:MAG: O-antigen ligase family protein [Phascolarctobacterium sp.]|nr:O-antigen ligase family protein [Candidatus Phascolarctobacterium caballi]
MNCKMIPRYYKFLLVATGICAVYPIGNVINFFSIIALCCLILSIYLGSFELSSELKHYIQAVFVWAVGCIFVSLTSDAVGVGVHTCYEWFIKWFGLMLLPFIFKQSKNVLKLCLVLDFGIVAVLSLLIAYRGMFLHEQRVGGYFTSGPMVLGVFLGLFIPILVICFFDKRIFGRWSYLPGIVALLTTVALLYNNTRGAEIGALICLIIVGFIYCCKSKKNLLIFALVATLLCGFIYFNPATRARWGKKSDGRIIIWQTSWKMFKDHPLFGVGFHRFRYAYKEIYNGYQGRRTGNNVFFHAHNLFLNAMVEGGLVGLTSFVFFFVFALWYPYKLWRRYRDPYSLMMLMLTLQLFINGMVETVIVHDHIMRPYWFLMGVLLSLHLQCRNR